MNDDDILVEKVERKLADDGTRTTLKGTPIEDIKEVPGGQNTDYVILSDAERAKGYVRPVRTKYKHLT